MVTHPSALKRHRQSEKRRVRNQAVKSRVKTVIKKVRAALVNRDAQAAEVHLRLAIGALDRAARKGILHRNNASRKISRLARQVHALKVSPSTAET